MKSETDMNTSNFCDTITSNLMVHNLSNKNPQHIKTLIDNIFSNSLNFSLGTSGNQSIFNNPRNLRLFAQKI